MEQEIQELHRLFTSSLQKIEEKLKKCSCKPSEKLRIDRIIMPSEKFAKKPLLPPVKKGIIKNWNDPRFWGLKIPEKVLCENYLANYQKKCLLERNIYLLNIRKEDISSKIVI